MRDKPNIELIENADITCVENPEKVLVSLLKEKGKILSVAESFTGGNVSAKITSVSGASAVFYEGIVAYNENAKNLRLGVCKRSLKNFKPVSYQVAGEMAFGLVKSGNAQMGISTTGIAGPNSDDSNFPVGLCFIGVSFNGKTTAYKFNFSGDRAKVVEKGVITALNLAIQTIK